jgi:serine/threonine protein kinase
LRRECLQVGKTTGDYRIIKVLGQGGFAITYLVEDMNLGKPFALKEFFPFGLCKRSGTPRVEPISMTCNVEFELQKSKFYQEAKTLASFSHPNICSILRVFQNNNTAYMVMEYVKGRSLSQLLIDEGGTLNEKQLRTIILPILDGILTLHRHGIIHRDIKPDNIYIKDDSTPILLDFGAARDYTVNDGINLSTILTPQFAPIEQFEKLMQEGPFTDIYSLGCVLYNCVTGKLPTPAPQRIIKPCEMKTTQELCSGNYSDVLLRAIDLAIQLNPEKRPQTIQELQLSIDGFGSKHENIKAISDVAWKIQCMLVLWATKEFCLSMDGWEAVVFTVAFPASDYAWRMGTQFQTETIWQGCRDLLDLENLMSAPNQTEESRKRIILNHPDIKSLFCMRFEEYSAAYLVDRTKPDWNKFRTLSELFIRNLFIQFRSHSITIPEDLLEWSAELIDRARGRCKKSLSKKDPRWGTDEYPDNKGKPIQ